MKSKKKIVLAYSGGLDTSIILKWLQENYDAEVICYTADVGQEINRKKIISNAKKFGVTKIIIKDLKDVFVKDYVYPMIRGHAIYEGIYLLGTSIARPLIAKDQIRVAKKFKAYADLGINFKISIVKKLSDQECRGGDKRTKYNV